MPDPITIAVLAAACLAASTVAAATGFGGAVILLPMLTWAFGVRDAVPVLTVLQLVGNAARVGFNRADVRPPLVGWFAAGAVPAAVAGGLLFAAAPLPVLKRVAGGFLWAAVAFRQVPGLRPAAMRPAWLAPVGAGSGLLSALAGSAGPVTAPFFLACGLTRGAYIGTEAAAALVTHAAKLAAYGEASILTPRHLAAGATLGAVMIAGSYLGKRLVDRLPERAFMLAVEAVLLVAGFQLLFFG